MRLSSLHNGQRLQHRLKLALMGALSGLPAPDVVRMLMYRPEFFGRPYSDWLHQVMRGPSEWRVGERELFAAFTSHLNRCQFCVSGHTAASVQALEDKPLVQAALQDWRSAPLDGRLKAVLELIEQLTLAPQQLSEADIDRVRASGVSDGAMADAIQICALFNIINRLADAFSFDTSMSEHPDLLAENARRMLRFGYQI